MHGEQAQTARALETRVRQLEHDAQNVHALAVDVERLARERCGADADTPAPGASTDAILSTARDALQARPESAAAAGETVAALIKIRDDLLAAIRHGGDGATMARWAYDQLGDVLKLEGVTALEEQGQFDPERQQPLETRDTDDPAQDRTVAATVRPGYAASGTLIRAQEVVVYAVSGSHAPKSTAGPPQERP